MSLPPYLSHADDEVPVVLKMIVYGDLRIRVVEEDAADLVQVLQELHHFYEENRHIVQAIRTDTSANHSHVPS
jgi:hypothetical protein